MDAVRSIPLLAWLDWAVIAVFLAFCVGVGLWASRRVRDAGGYLLANRGLGRLLTMSTNFASSINANDPVNIASATYRTGLSGIWVALHFILLTPWYWMVAPLGRRVRCVTTMDLVRLRMGRPLEAVYLAVSVLAGAFGMGVGIKAAAAAVAIVSGGSIGEHLALVLVVVPTLIYALLGGLLAVAVTDLAMSGLIIVLSFLLIPFAIAAIGGVDAMRPPAVPAAHYDLLGTAGAGGGQRFTWLTLAWLVIGSLFAVGGVSPSSARNEVVARVGSLAGPVKRLCTIGWASVGLVAVVLLGPAASAGVPADEVFARMSGQLLPDGLRGVMVAALLAAVMSTIAGTMLQQAGGLVNNLYRQYLRPQAGAGEYLLAARLASVLVMAAGTVVMLSVDQDIVTFSLNALHILTVFGLPLLLCFLWRGVTAVGAGAGAAAMAVMFVCGSLLKVPQAPEWYIGLAGLLADAYAWCGHGEIALPAAAAPLKDQVLPIEIRLPLLLTPGLVATVLVSLATRQHDPRRVAEFYARLDTPVGDEAELAARGIQPDLIDGIGGRVVVDPRQRDVQRRMLLPDLLRLPALLWRREATWWDYRLDLLGLAISAVFIGGFLLLLAGMARLLS